MANAINYKTALKLKWPNKAIVQYSDTYENIIFNNSDGIPNPTKAELDAAIADLSADTGVDASQVNWNRTDDNYGVNLSGIRLTQSGVVAGTYSNMQVDTYGRVISARALNSADITSALGHAVGGGKLYTGTLGAVTATSVIPSDNTTPMASEGTQLWSKTVTPSSTASTFVIDHTVMLDVATDKRYITLALFRDSVCIAAVGTYFVNRASLTTVTVHAVDVPNTSSNVTYSLRAGINSSGLFYVNYGNDVPTTYGGAVNKSNWTIVEY